MSNGQHTPTPWQLANYGYGKKAGLIYEDIFSDGKHENRICRLFLDDNENQLANAEFICRAVNCHDELLEALEDALALAGSPSPLWDKTRLAIAKAQKPA